MASHEALPNGRLRNDFVGGVPRIPVERSYERKEKSKILAPRGFVSSVGAKALACPWVRAQGSEDAGPVGARRPEDAVGTGAVLGRGCEEAGEVLGWGAGAARARGAEGGDGDAAGGRMAAAARTWGAGGAVRMVTNG